MAKQNNKPEAVEEKDLNTTPENEAKDTKTEATGEQVPDEQVADSSEGNTPSEPSNQLESNEDPEESSEFDVMGKGDPENDIDLEEDK